jgi:hypothetical protein
MEVNGESYVPPADTLVYIEEEAGLQNWSGRGIEDNAGSRTSIEKSHILNARKRVVPATRFLNCLRNQSLFIWRGSIPPFVFLFGLLLQRSSNIGLGVRLEEATVFPKEVSEVVQDISLVYSGGFMSVAFLHLMIRCYQTEVEIGLAQLWVSLLSVYNCLFFT